MKSTKKKATESAKATQTEKNYAKVNSFKVSNVRTLKSGDTFFDLRINEVAIYGCKAVETPNYPIFIGWPQRKGTDGNYYNVASVFLSSEDTKKIIDQVQDILDKEDEKPAKDEGDDIPF